MTDAFSNVRTWRQKKECSMRYNPPSFYSASRRTGGNVFLEEEHHNHQGSGHDHRGGDLAPRECMLPGEAGYPTVIGCAF
jgi:hypothetical protein